MRKVYYYYFSTADPRIHETPNLDSDAEFPDAEFRFSQILYQGQSYWYIR
jgi:hypothetical protein